MKFEKEGVTYSINVIQGDSKGNKTVNNSHLTDETLELIRNKEGAKTVLTDHFLNGYAKGVAVNMSSVPTVTGGAKKDIDIYLNNFNTASGLDYRVILHEAIHGANNYQRKITKNEVDQAKFNLGLPESSTADVIGSTIRDPNAIMQAERERNLGQQLGDIQSRGSQRAFESAQQQLERERASGMGAARFGLEQFGAQQQALQSQEQMAQASFNASEQARQQAASMGMNAQQQEEAARQAQEKFAQSAFGAQQQAMQA